MSMLLRLLLLLASLCLLPTPAAAVAHASVDELVASALTADDCCCPEAERLEGDCCDVDGGACCAPSSASALAGPMAPEIEPDPVWALPRGHDAVPLHLLRPRDHGPPPTPPPI
jgi:hypothetical protein